jgi:hypothetical protein
MIEIPYIVQDSDNGLVGSKPAGGADVMGGELTDTYLG